MSNNVETNILVNGSRCKQYHHQGKIFIESKDKSEYTIEIKNNCYGRIMVCCSVDGLNIINGKSTTPDGPGYIIPLLDSGKYDGFRVSDSKVAKFIFDKKETSYAASKNDGSDQNVGVIGIRVFSERLKPSPFVWCGTGSIGSWGQGLTGPIGNWGQVLGGTADGNFITTQYSSCNVSTACLGSNTTLMNASSITTQNPFDMGTKWGNAKESKVVEVEFERGVQIASIDIYYASRQSLIELGVPIGNEKQVYFPSAFKDSKYATPPDGWCS